MSIGKSSEFLKGWRIFMIRGIVYWHRSPVASAINTDNGLTVADVRILTAWLDYSTAIYAHTSSADRVGVFVLGEVFSGFFAYW